MHTLTHALVHAHTRTRKHAHNIVLGLRPGREGYNAAPLFINPADASIAPPPRGRVTAWIDLATQHNQLLSSVAIGSAEGFRQATDAINSAVRLGRYIT